MSTSNPSLKSTKQEILDAYESLRSEHEASKLQKIPAPLAEMKKKEDQAVIEKTSSITSESIEQHVMALKKKAVITLDTLLADLALQSEQLAQLRQARQIEEQYLVEVRNIKLADNALALLIAEYDEKKATFENESKQTQYTLQESIDAQKKLWEREQDEYAFTLKMKRRKEEEEYALSQAAQRAKEDTLWREREDILVKKEEEFARLAHQVSSFSEEKERAVTEAVEKITIDLTREHGSAMQLVTQALDSEKTTSQLKIAGFEETVKNLNVEIHSLKDALAKATQHAQALATTVIENMSGSKQANILLAQEKAKVQE